MDEAFNFRKPRERKKKNLSPADLRRTLGKIYPEEMVDELMKNLGFEEEQPEEIDFDYAAEDDNG